MEVFWNNLHGGIGPLGPFLKSNIVPVIVVLILFGILIYLQFKNKKPKDAIISCIAWLIRLTVYPVLLALSLGLFFFPNYLRVWNAGVIPADSGGKDKREIVVAFMTDFHVMDKKDKRWIRKLVDKTNGLKPDMVLLGGDYVFEDPEDLADIYEPFKDLKAPLGVYAVLGNHDYGFPGKDISKKIEKIFDGYGIKVLHNEWMEPARNLVLIGIDDLWSGRCDHEKTFKNVPGDGFRLVFSHNPDVLLRDPPPCKYKAGVWVFGHSHGGQVKAPFFHPSYFVTRLNINWGEFDFPQGKVLISQGAGQLRFRFFTNPEILMFRIKYQ